MEKGQVGATSILGVGVSIPSIIAEDGKSLTYSPIIGAINIYEDLKNILIFLIRSSMTPIQADMQNCGMRRKLRI